MATLKTMHFVKATLKQAGFTPSKSEVEAIASEVEAIASELEDEEAIASAEFEDDAVASDEFDDDAFMSEDDELEAVASDEDDAYMSDEDDDAFLSDDFEDDAFASDDFEEEAATMSRRKAEARRKAELTRKAAKRKASSQKAYVPAEVKQYIDRLERRMKSLEMQEAPGERSRGMKSARMQVTDVADRKGAYKATFMKYLRNGEGWLSSTEKYVLQSRKTVDRGGVDSYSSESTKAMKALNISDPGSVGFGVPDDFINEVNKNVMVDAETAANCKVYTTTSDSVLQPDLVTADGRQAFQGEMSFPGENPASQSEHNTTEISLAQIQIPVHVGLTSTYATLSALEDTGFDLQALITEQFAEQIARMYERLIWSGNGSGKMRGIVNDPRVTGALSTGVSSVGGYVASGNATTIKSGDPLIKMQLQLPPGYRKRAKWYMNSNTAAVISQLKDGQGRYLWGDEQGLNQGIPTSLKNMPIVYNEYSSDIAADAFPLILADLSRGYLIVKRVEFSIRRYDDSVTGAQDVALFMGRVRVGGQVIQPAAIKALKIAV